MTDTHGVAPTGAEKPKGRSVFSRIFSRKIGLGLVIFSILATGLGFAILMGFTPIAPDQTVTLTIALVIAGLIVALTIAVLFEVFRLLRARQKKRVAARLHIRIVSLFAVIAAIPAVIIAIIASITLDIGLDRWFSDRTQRIVQSSITVAQSYLNEHARFLVADLDAVARDYDRLRFRLLNSEAQTIAFLTTQARVRNIPHLKIIDRQGTEIASANVGSPREWPKAPDAVIENAASKFERVPILISPGRTENLVGVLMRLNALDDQYLYAIRAVDPEVVRYLRDAEENAAEYSSLREGRAGSQIAFALLYLGVALVLVVSSVWLAISFADGLVNPIRQLMTAANAVSKGDLNIQVPVRKREGDIGTLSETFNVMTAQLSEQRQELLKTNTKLDERRRFIETVLSGVSASVVGLSAEGRVDVINSSGLALFGIEESAIIGKPLEAVVPELEALLDESRDGSRDEYNAQISLIRQGQERTVNARMTRTASGRDSEGFVLTLDDITDLVTAQRTSAWADVARRIAHEIKNPLTPIQLSAERLRRRFGRDLEDKDQEVFDKCTSTIVRQVGDIGRMVDEFSSFARMPKPTFVKADLRDCLKEAVYLREVAQPEIEFTTDLPDKPLHAYFDERLFSQAIGNLIKNAGEAVEAVAAQEGYKGRISVTGRANGEDLVIEITDNGKGWPKENRNKLLEPYMTTRKKGTGLG
ncbi:MAG: PAS domain-containing sensor histidine kinase, partial [Pseudomonadota bacterium]